MVEVTEGNSSDTISTGVEASFRAEFLRSGKEQGMVIKDFAHQDRIWVL